jgi:AAA+ superfamily predicted ATPase
LTSARAVANRLRSPVSARIGAKALGFNTRDGQKRIREAYNEVLERTPNKDWDW